MDKEAWYIYTRKYCSCCLVTQLCLTILQSHALWPAKLLCPRDFPGKNTDVDFWSAILLSVKKSDIMPFATARMDPEIAIVSEVTKRRRNSMIFSICRIQKEI